MAVPRPTESRKDRAVFTLAPDPTALLRRRPDSPPEPYGDLDAVLTALGGDQLKIRYGLVGGYTPLRFCHDRRIRVGAEGEPGEITWEAEVTRDMLRVKELPWTMVPSADWLVTSGPANGWVLRRLSSGSLFTTVRPERGAAKHVLVSPRGDRLLLSFEGDAPELQLYSIPEGQHLGSARLPDAATTLAVAPDGAAVAAGTADGWVRLFSLADLSPGAAFGIESAWAPASMALSPGATRVATSLRTGEVVVWGGDGTRLGDATASLEYRGKGALAYLADERLILRAPDGVRTGEIGPRSPVATVAPRDFSLREATPPPTSTDGAGATLAGRGLLPRSGEDLVPGRFWEASGRAACQGGRWVDTDTGLPLFAWRTKDGAPMVLVPAGAVSARDAVPPNQRPGCLEGAAPEASLGAFYVDQFPVTVSMMAAYLEATGAEAPDDWEGQRAREPRAPVVFVHHADARGYARWAGGVLPTELEWIRAARGADPARFPWTGEVPEGVTAARYDQGEGGAPTSVDAHPAGASPFAVCDLAGNVAEWCVDPYPPTLEGDPYLWETPDPMGPPCRVAKGGAFRDAWVRLRVTGRWALPEEERSRWVGFRLVVPVKERPEPSAPTAWSPPPSEA